MSEQRSGLGESAASGDKPGSFVGGEGDGHGRRAEENLERGRGMVNQLFGDMRHAAEEMVEQRKERAAEGVAGFADALRRTAGNLRGENETIARYAERAADRVEQLSETVRERHLGEIIAEVDEFARRQPTLFLIGALVAGFIAGRFVAASSERAEERDWRVASTRRVPHGTRGNA
jgi:hypothetical protein